MDGVALRLAHGDTLSWQPDVSWLAVGERARLASLGSDRRRQDFLAGRWLLRLTLSECAGSGPDEQRVDIDADGRTLCEPGLFANLSHSGDWLACAVADTPVGVDIERADRPRGDLAGLAAMVHGPTPCAELAGVAEPQRLRRFYELWTLKEAALKRAGLGLDFARMRAMEFRPDPTGDALSLVHEEAGLVLAVLAAPEMKTPALPAGVRLVERLRLVEKSGPQSTPKSK
ncbi:4'-phosphopantetheinyl transferase superfamily protein [Paucibacter sp. R3-3]|uniref:4'-phosphopantetheinyl transferase superfamily protein n=1 Tax=Roseateles agri TaxID=3098619 RepID=A0ABU5DFL4_9BURK|nr:4'-phosphopantetheinyl transferase superfamily protein [Paucibacter sp. R3-3]MDY0745046.1 4'-phosphopantetheinyl transferase superfamily protein [Paucibacter sp. R3-3]